MIGQFKKAYLYKLMEILHCEIFFEKLASSVMVSIDFAIFIFSTFRPFSYYSIMWSMNFFL